MNSPLAEQLRPQELGSVVGQDHLVSPTGFITKIIQSKKPLSIILWGPPGCGKTTIARLYAKAFALNFKNMSAIFSGIADIKKIIQDMHETPLFGKQIVLFVDEIHRFNKAQQDAFLPFVENGTIILVGATAENPSFHLNNALLSRVRVLTLNTLKEESLEILLSRYESTKKFLNLTKDARAYLLSQAQGDGRYLLNLVENIQGFQDLSPLTLEDLKTCIQKRAALFDKSGDQHYNIISAFHKAIRGSDPDASIYWLTRLLEGGEDPLFIARRLIRMASEDIGLADPQALQVAISGKQALETLGSPEGALSLAQVALYLALAPKSNALYNAYNKAKEISSETSNLPPPTIILNAPTKLMKELNYGKDYIYDHDTQNGFSGQNYFPDKMERVEFYKPKERGFEREMKKRIEYFKMLRKEILDATY